MANVNDPKGDLNLDPLSGEPGAHPVGTGLGAAGGAAAGAAVGAIGGPIGAAIGAVVGAVAGGLAGKGAAEIVNPTDEEAFWRDNFTSEPYYNQDLAYEDYSPAYRAGYLARLEGVESWNDARTDWERRWDAEHAQSRLKWQEAEPAIRAAWERADRQYLQRKQE